MEFKIRRSFHCYKKMDLEWAALSDMKLLKNYTKKSNGFNNNIRCTNQPAECCPKIHLYLLGKASKFAPVCWIIWEVTKCVNNIKRSSSKNLEYYCIF